MQHKLSHQTKRKKWYCRFYESSSFDVINYIIEFGVEDIVRSGLVKEFILAKMELNL